MKRIIPLIVCLGTISPVVQAELSANVGVTSNYVFRGFTQTDDDPAIQGGIDYTHPSGFYAGAWASQVKMPRGGQNNHDVTGLEVDGYMGITTELEGGFILDLGLIQYSYTDSDLDASRELYFGLGFGPVTGTYYWGTDTNPGASDYQYLDVKFKMDLGDDVNLLLHYGRKDPDNGEIVSDISAGLSKEILGADVSVTATTEDKRGSKQEELFLTITKTFDLK